MIYINNIRTYCETMTVMRINFETVFSLCAEVLKRCVLCVKKYAGQLNRTNILEYFSTPPHINVFSVCRNMRGS